VSCDSCGKVSCIKKRIAPEEPHNRPAHKVSPALVVSTTLLTRSAGIMVRALESLTSTPLLLRVMRTFPTPDSRNRSATSPGSS